MCELLQQLGSGGNFCCILLFLTPYVNTILNSHKQKYRLGRVHAKYTEFSAQKLREALLMIMLSSSPAKNSWLCYKLRWLQHFLNFIFQETSLEKRKVCAVGKLGTAHTTGMSCKWAENLKVQKTQQHQICTLVLWPQRWARTLPSWWKLLLFLLKRNDLELVWLSAWHTAQNFFHV